MKTILSYEQNNGIKVILDFYGQKITE